jgi:hypothetical protein
MKALQDIFSLNLNRTNVKPWILCILIIATMLTATVSGGGQIVSWNMSINITTLPTPAAGSCVPPAQCMQQDGMMPETYVKASEIPCMIGTVLAADGIHEETFYFYCYQKPPARFVAPTVSAVPLVTSKASGVIARQVAGSVPTVIAPQNRTTLPHGTGYSTSDIAVAAPNPLPGTGTQVPGTEGTTVPATMIGRDRFGGETKVPSGTRSLQATEGTPPVFGGELLKNESNREKILVSLQQQDPAINNIRGDENSLGVDYARKAKLFGVFETRYTETVTVQKNGDIRVDKPWWLAFTTRDDADQMDQMDLQDNLPKQEQAMQTVSSIMKMQNDTVKQIIDNVRA